MSRQCTICVHPDRASIDSELTRGTPSRALAERFGVSASAVQRHARRHLSPALAALKSEEQAKAKASLLERIESVIHRAETMFAAAANEGRTTQALDVLKELRLQLELLGKATGELNDRPQVTVNLMASPEWLAVRDVVLSALMAYPEARAAVSGRLLGLEAGS
jgi:hypothetical protein